MAGLTTRELEILKLRKEGKTQAEIAQKLKISQPAVSSFERNALKKIESAKELLETLKKMGLLVLALAFFVPFLSEQAHAQTPNPGHSASRIGAGTFAVGAFAFQQNLSVNGSLFFVNSQTRYIGIGTPNPNSSLEVNGTFRVANASNGTLLTVLMFPNGSAKVGIGVTNPNNALSVSGGINASGAIGQTSGLDIAEEFGGVEPMEAGDIVAIVDRDHVKKSTIDDAFLTIGVVSTQPGFLMGKPGLTNSKFIGLAGRVPVKVEGAVLKGDYITVSSTPGVGIVATQPSFVVGRALEDANGGQVMILVNPGYFSPRVDTLGNLIGGSEEGRKFEPAANEVLDVSVSVPRSNETNETTEDLTVSGELQTNIITPAEGQDVVVIIG